MARQSCSSPGPIAIDSITHDMMFDGSRRYSPMTHLPFPPPPTPETVFFDLDDAIDALHLDEPAGMVSPSLPTLCQDCDRPPGSTGSDAWLDRVESWIEQTEQSRPAQIVGNQEIAALTPASQPHEAGPSSRPVLGQYLTPAQTIGSHQTCNLAPMRVGYHQHQATHSCAPTLCNIHALSLMLTGHRSRDRNAGHQPPQSVHEWALIQVTQMNSAASPQESLSSWGRGNGRGSTQTTQILLAETQRVSFLDCPGRQRLD